MIQVETCFLFDSLLTPRPIPAIRAKTREVRMLPLPLADSMKVRIEKLRSFRAKQIVDGHLFEKVSRSS